MNVQDIPALSTQLGIRDRVGRWRVRWSIGRGRYRVEPGLYKVGASTPDSPVLVTANYKLSVDTLRSGLVGVDAWILVLDTNGVNVWCAAGKGTFGTDELVRRVQASDLSEIVSHRKLIVPQLGATGVAAHEVRSRCGFKVVYGPVRARDIRPFLEAGLRATDDMRRVTFTITERLELVGVEVVPVLKWFLLLIIVIAAFRSGTPMFDRLVATLRTSAPILAGLLAGTALTPALLPWIPGRAFSFKGAVVGGIAVAATLALVPDARSELGMVRMFLFGTAAASFLAMQFTGATTFTSPSGVEWEMKRALVFQVGAIVLGCGIAIAELFVG